MYKKVNNAENNKQDKIKSIITVSKAILYFSYKINCNNQHNS